jgi:hypothetical protein
MGGCFGKPLARGRVAEFARGRRAYLTDEDEFEPVVVAVYCPHCSAREFAEDGG